MIDDAELNRLQELCDRANLDSWDIEDGLAAFPMNRHSNHFIAASAVSLPQLIAEVRFLKEVVQKQDAEEDRLIDENLRLHKLQCEKCGCIRCDGMENDPCAPKAWMQPCKEQSQ